MGFHKVSLDSTAPDASSRYFSCLYSFGTLSGGGTSEAVETLLDLGLWRTRVPAALVRPEQSNAQPCLQCVEVGPQPSADIRRIDFP